MSDYVAPIIGFDDARGVPIAEVSRVLGIPMPTLRSWELRYGMPAISGARGRHRRYLPADVQAIRLMRDETARGQQAGLAAAEVRRVLGIGGPAGVFIHQLLEQSERQDTNGIRHTLDQAADTLGLANCVDEVLLPAMRQVGTWWEIGHCDIAQESGRGTRRLSRHPPPGRLHPGRQGTDRHRPAGSQLSARRKVASSATSGPVPPGARCR